ncbi:unnamed protein product [Pedinophyceae sp. YPF-701]|nr:unnamed protein product [Pedinophyceae sp. YPF-701]
MEKTLVTSTVPALLRLAPGIAQLAGSAGIFTAARLRQHPHSESDSEHDDVVRLTVNGRAVSVPRGSTILKAAQTLGITVPTLCYHERTGAQPGSCRVCQVEVGGRQLPACCTVATEGAAVVTDSAAVRASTRFVLGALERDHPHDCMTCSANGECHFQDLLNRYGVGSAGRGGARPGPCSYALAQPARDEPALLPCTDDAWGHKRTASNAIEIDFEKCVHCGRCAHVCGEVQHMGILGFVGRGRDSRMGIEADLELPETPCIDCGQCSSVCPTGAIHERESWRDVLDEIDAGRKVMVAQVAPSVRFAIGEETGMGPGVASGQMVAALKQLGFAHVFDTNFTADLTILEEATELVARLAANLGLPEINGIPAAPLQGGAPPRLPMFTSCCPAWINYVEKDAPEWIDSLSSCRSPMMMMAPLIKGYWAATAGVDPRDIVSVAIMPCTAKKHERTREQFQGTVAEDVADVDYVLTTRELGKMMRTRRVHMATLPPQDFDNPMGVSSGAADVFAASGGVMEAALRTAYHLLTRDELADLDILPVRGFAGVKEAVIPIPVPALGTTIEARVAVVNGIGNVGPLLEAIRNGDKTYHFVEVMSCPAGCIAGGGQPKAQTMENVYARARSVYATDASKELRVSHKNPYVIDLYGTWLGGGLTGPDRGHKAHHMLHTHYTDRSGTKRVA